MSKDHDKTLENDIELKQEAPHESPLDAGSNETIAALLETMEALTRERDDAKEQVLRTMAEFQNFRRRTQEETERLRKTATEHLVRQLLPVLDNFERSIAAVESGASVESVMDGIRVIDKQMRAVLESVSLTKIPSIGSAFDPEFHEALGVHEDPELPDETVTHELEPGYVMGGKVIRPAKVRVSKKP